MARHPAARASAARDMLGFTEQYRPGTEAEIRAGIPRESLHAIDTTIGIAWLGVEHDHWLMDRTIATLGREGAIDCWHRAMAMMVQRPLLRPVVEAALRLFPDPAGMVRTIVRGWSLAYRDFCTPRFEPVRAGEARIVFEDVAPEAFTSEGYLHCWHAVCLGVFDLARAGERQVTFEIERPRARATATFLWR
jgi:hypothetical protein